MPSEEWVYQNFTYVMMTGCFGLDWVGFRKDIASIAILLTALKPISVLSPISTHTQI